MTRREWRRGQPTPMWARILGVWLVALLLGAVGVAVAMVEVMPW